MELQAACGGSGQVRGSGGVRLSGGGEAAPAGAGGRDDEDAGPCQAGHGGPQGSGAGAGDREIDDGGASGVSARVHPGGEAGDEAAHPPSHRADQVTGRGPVTGGDEVRARRLDDRRPDSAAGSRRHGAGNRGGHGRGHGRGEVQGGQADSSGHERRGCLSHRSQEQQDTRSRLFTRKLFTEHR